MTRAPTPLGNARVIIRQGDDLPGFAAQIIDERGEPLDLTNATVRLRIIGDRVEQDDDGTFHAALLLNDDCWIVNAQQGVITYDWSHAQTDAWWPGIYAMHVEISYADGRVTGAPSDRSVDFVVRPRVFGAVAYIPPLPATAMAVQQGGL